MDPKMIAALSQAHDAAKAQYAQVQQVGSMLDTTRRELDTLVNLGDNVTAEDIIKGAGALVGAGGDPAQLAGMLADMPQGGAALAAWVRQQDLMVKQKEAQMLPAQALAGHHMATSALRILMANHMAAQRGGPPTASAMPPPNALMGAPPSGNGS